MAQFERWFTQDLTQRIEVRHCENIVFSADNLSTLVGVNVYHGGESAALSGTVVCYAIRADGNTVEFAGDLSGNAVSAVLPQSCFVAQGPLAVMLQLITGTGDNAQKTTLLKAIFSVELSSTGAIIDPGHVVPDLADIIAMMDQMEQATDAANAAALAAGYVNIISSKTGHVITIATTNRENQTTSITVTEPTFSVSKSGDIVTFTATDADGTTTAQVTDPAGMIPKLAPAITETAAGAIVTITDGADNVPVKSLIAQINPVQAGSGDPSPENIRAITGWTGCTISHSGEDTSDPEEYIIAFPIEAGTVYGGTLDVINGVLTVTWAAKVFDGTETLTYNTKDSNYISVYTTAQETDRVVNHVLCSHLKTQGSGNTQNIIRNRASANGISMFFGRTAICDLDTSAFIALSNAEKVALVNAYMADQYTAGTPVTVVYQLMEPITYQLSPIEVSTLLGINNIWADTGDVTVEYRADTKMYIDNQIAALQATILENISNA